MYEAVLPLKKVNMWLASLQEKTIKAGQSSQELGAGHGER